MKFASVATSASFVLLALISNVSAAALDVFVPKITSPKAGDVWTSGQQQVVTWDTSNAPASITNKIARILLRKGDLTTPLILANNLDILAGQAAVTVPLVVEGNDYQVVLFGDSGDFSPAITITGSGIDF